MDRIMKFPKGTIARNNRTDEKYVLDYEVEAFQDDSKGLVYRIQDSRGDYIFIKDNEKPERNPFPEFKDLPKVFIGEIELNPIDLKIVKLKKSRRVTKFSRYGR